MWGLGSRGVGFGVQGVGFRVSGLGRKAAGPAFPGLFTRSL